MRLFIAAVSTLFALGILPSDTATDFSKRYGPPICEAYRVSPRPAQAFDPGATIPA
jgi:hypothetical protein